MTSVFTELNDHQLTAELEAVLLPRLAEVLRSRAPGHCMRVADLDQSLMLALTDGLRRDVPAAQVHILTDQPELTRSDHRFITSTKLVELRNPDDMGELRPALLVFLPANLRTSAEDSFGIATFEEIPVSGVYDELLQRLQARIPPPLQSIVRLLFDEVGGWFVAHIEARVRFLLTAISNGADRETLGAALYEIGLVPDLHLFGDQSRALGRIQQNVKSVSALTTSDLSLRGRVLALNLVDRTLQRRVMQLLIDIGTADPRRWAKQIILDRKNWDLTFDKWRFADERNPDKIGIFAVKTDLPTVHEESELQLQGLVGQQLLTPQTRRKLTVTFQVDPLPTQVTGLDFFTVQLMTREAGTGNISTPIGVSKRVKVWKAKRASCTVTLDKLNRVAFPEEGGWCFVRVLPWTAEGDPVPTETTRSQTPGDTFEAIPSNESEPFYVIPGDTNFEEEERPQRAIPRAESVQHARLRVQFKVAREGRDPSGLRPDVVTWEDGSKKTRPHVRDMVRVTFRGEGIFNVPVVHSLQQLETRLLTQPAQLLQLELCIENGRPTTHEREPITLPELPSRQHFLEARTDYFAAIRADEAELVSQAADFEALHDRCVRYAIAYRNLLKDLYVRVEASAGSERNAALRDVLLALQLDTVAVHISQSHNRHRTRTAALLSPTHPLRALWFTTWTEVSQRWLAAARNGPHEYISIVEDAVLRRLAPLNTPPTLIRTLDTVYMPVDNISPFWALYAEHTEEDVRGLFSEVCAALQAPEPAISGTAVTGEALAARIERYLNQHPYVRTLTLNVFNPGRAQVVADALVLLQKQQPFEYLRYDIRLFVPDREAPGIGEAVLQLLTPDASGRAETDVFGLSTGSHLHPKLSLAVRGMDEFRDKPEGFRAHVSVLLDVFPATTVGAAPAIGALTVVPLYGLAQEFVSRYSDQDSERSLLWERQPRHGKLSQYAAGLASAELLVEVPSLMSGLTATILTRDPVVDHSPTISLSLSPEQRALLHRVHEVSDWVCTIDRNLGIEFFDHARTDRPEYLIDYVPGKVTSGGHRLIVTTRSVVELSALLRPVLDRYGLPHQGNQVALILRQLRLLSGRLALKLISLAPSQRAEALGLALGYRYLDQQRALHNQILVPLDDHIDLFHQVNQIDDEGAATLHRTDLALFELDRETRTITCRLVEVKCYAHVTGLAAYQQLKETIAQQIGNSELILRRQFDPQFDHTRDRPDRALKTRELALLLEFYLERNVRYRLMSTEAAKEGRTLLGSLEDGYDLAFTRSALVFDFTRDGTEEPDRDHGIEYHRIGANLIRGLMSAQQPTLTETAQDEMHDEHQGLPFLQEAAFVSPRQDRTTTLESLNDNVGASVQEQPADIQAVVPGVSVSKDETSHDNNHVDGDNHAPTTVTSASQAVNPATGNPAWESQEQEETRTLKFAETPDHQSGQPIRESSIAPHYDILLGAQADSPQYGILGEVAGRKVALDLDQTHTISLFGVQGGGKSYTLGSIIEMACLPILHINQLLNPLATVLFHYSATKEYKPEFVTMDRPNSVAEQIATLRERYRGQPQALRDIVLLTPKTQLDERREEYPDITVEPMTFSSAELKASHWKFLMGAVGNQSLYLRQINLIIRRLRNNLLLDQLLDEVERSPMADHMKETARARLQLAAEYIDDSRHLGSLVKSGRLIIVDLRDDTIEKDEALGLFVVLLQIFSEATQNEGPFNKLVVFDEAHKYMENADLVAGLIEVVREMRHKGTSILVASQEPRSVPQSLIELSSQIILHRFNSPDWLRYIQKTNTALSSLTPEKMNSLGPGEAYVWSSKASDPSFSSAAVKIRCRPRVTQHGGATKTAVARLED